MTSRAKDQSPVRISYSQLRDDPSALSYDIQRAFGSDPGSLGIILVDGT
jgi:hypothetical protein